MKIPKSPTIEGLRAARNLLVRLLAKERERREQAEKHNLSALLHKDCKILRLEAEAEIELPDTKRTAIFRYGPEEGWQYVCCRFREDSG